MLKRIYYHDTDAGGIVYYGTYLSYLEEARTEFLENKGMSVLEFKKRGLFYAVRYCNIVYKSPARYADTIECIAQIKEATAAQLIFDQKIVNKADGKLVVTAEVGLVCLTADFKPVALPDDVRDRLLAP